MKIGIARIWQETNTFSPNATTLDHYNVNGLYVGDEVMKNLDNSPELTGAVQAAGTYGQNVELVPLVSAMAWPAGRLTEKTFFCLKEIFFNALDSCENLDGLFISLHGALTAENCDDFEGELISSARSRLGRNIPISISLDLHANITCEMIESTDIIVGYHTCPHLDLELTGQKAMELLINTIHGKSSPAVAWRKIPMIVPADRHNHTEGPFKKLFSRVAEIEKFPDVLSCSVFAVQPWLDIKELGWSVIVITDNDIDIADKLADELARECWDLREEFFVEKVSAKEAVQKALSVSGKPVVISDSADSTNAGSAGNSTWLLQEIINEQTDETVFMTMVAPDVARNAHKSGADAVLNAEFGTTPVNPFCPPITIRAKVKSLHDGKIHLSGHLGKNLHLNIGKSAVLKSGSVVIVVSENPGPGHVPPEFFKQFGLDVTDAKIIIAKSPVGFRSAYEPIAAEIILCETAGPSCSDLSALNFQRIPMPMYPFEKDINFLL